MVASLDGMIAKPDNSIAWFDTKDYYENGTEITPQQAADFLKTIDCYVMGARTYEHALELSKNYGWAYGDTPTIVLTHRPLPAIKPGVQLYAGSLHALVEEQLKPRYKNVWVAGGAILAKNFINEELADEIRLTIIPVVLGDGVPFFKGPGQEHLLHLLNVTPYKTGMVELQYGIRK